MIGKSPHENSDFCHDKPARVRRRYLRSRWRANRHGGDPRCCLEDSIRFFLHARAQQQDVPFRPFDIEADYLNYVDGRPRDDGIRNFLASRGLSLPQGSEHDPEDGDTVHSLGERKTWLFRQALQKGIAPTAGADALLQKLRKAGIKTAVGSSSKNTAAILHAATRRSVRYLHRRS